MSEQASVDEDIEDSNEDIQDNIEDDLEYEYEYDENDENCSDDEGSSNKRAKIDILKSRRKYIGCSSDDLVAWSVNNSIKISIVSSIRQILNHPSDSFSISFSPVSLHEESVITKEFTIFVDIPNYFTLSYTLHFNSLKTLSESPPRLRCNIFCGGGSYMYPNLLLPNHFGPVLDFGRILHELSEIIMTKFKHKVDTNGMFDENSNGYLIQDLAYLTEYFTSYIVLVEDNGIATGMTRKSHKSGDNGVGYSSCNDSTTIKVDRAMHNEISGILTKILKNCGISVKHTADTIRNAMNSISYLPLVESPLLELLCYMLVESSAEEVVHYEPHYSLLFVCFAVIQHCYTKAIQIQQLANSDSGEVCLRVPSIYYSALHKLVTYQRLMGGDYHLDLVQCSREDIDKMVELSICADFTLNGDGGKTSGAEDSDANFEMVSAFPTFIYATSKPVCNSMSQLRRINVEFSTLQSHLPKDIYVRVLEDNYYCIKFMLRGPEDTPYFGGYFIFDMVLPSDYPNNHPKVTLCTTGNGKVRFNPNLYNSGKVCLSLLGTWTGEAWDPKLSNINQVMQSILFLILVSDPYFNEPGYMSTRGTPVGTQRSVEYNKQVRRDNLESALLTHLNSPDPLFGSIILKNVKQSWRDQKLVYDEWAKEDSSLIPIIEKISSKVSKL